MCSFHHILLFITNQIPDAESLYDKIFRGVSEERLVDKRWYILLRIFVSVNTDKLPGL